jgi:glucose/mannose-6-phosphate isomerase
MDSTNQLGEVLGLHEHVLDALWRVESAEIPAGAYTGGLLVAGMGGSAVGARLAAGAIGSRATAPIGLAGGYELPSWVGSDTLVLCSSYSGNTEETLAAYDAARALGAPRVVSTTGGALGERARADGVPVVPLPGGFQPRHAVGYATVVALEAARLAGASGDLRGEVEAAAQALRSFEEGEAEALADELWDTVPVIYGADLTAPVAYRWKCQFNENAKQHAFASELPEADHNEVCAWEAGSGFRAVFLEDAEQHPRNAERLRVTREVVGGGVVVPSAEGPPLARMMRSVLLGDVLTIHCALRRGEDPVTIDAIDRLKSSLTS